MAGASFRVSRCRLCMSGQGMPGGTTTSGTSPPGLWVASNRNAEGHCPIAVSSVFPRSRGLPLPGLGAQGGRRPVTGHSFRQMASKRPRGQSKHTFGHLAEPYNLDAKLPNDAQGIPSFVNIRTVAWAASNTNAKCVASFAALVAAFVALFVFPLRLGGFFAFGVASDACSGFGAASAMVVSYVQERGERWWLRCKSSNGGVAMQSFNMPTDSEPR